MLDICSEKGNKTDLGRHATARSQVVMDDYVHARDPSPTPAERARIFARTESTPPLSFARPGPRPTTFRDLKNGGRLSKIKGPTPGPYKYRGNVRQGHDFSTQHRERLESAQTSSPPNKGSSASPAVPHSPDRDMTLADIASFDLRLKVAKLMAVSPASPVKDIYDLVMEMKGHYHRARDHLSRTSQTPGSSARLQILLRPTHVYEDEEELVEVGFDNLNKARERRRRITQTPGLTIRPQILPEPTDQSEDGDVLVKLDFDDPDIYLDNDVPSSPSPPVAIKATARKKKQSGAHVKRSTAHIAKAKAKKTAKLTIAAPIA
jgi:hypothetical protein